MDNVRQHTVETNLTQTKGTYGIQSWDEKTWDGKDHKDVHGAKLTHAIIAHDFHGAIEGDVKVQYIMSYLDDSNATFTGIMQVNGKIGSRKGSFAALVNGKFEGGAAVSTWSIIPGSGTSELIGIKGEGATTATHGDTQPYTFDYSFEK